MCTLTWTSDPTRPGEYSLWFNRDERRTRAPEVPPKVQETAAGVRYIAPEDSEAGGTWILANEFGVTVAVLNGYLESRGTAPPEYRSRGALVRDLAGIRGTAEVHRVLSPGSMGRYRPVVLFVKTPESPALVARWDGLTLHMDPLGERQLPLTSSSYEQDDVQQSRGALYERLVAEPDRRAARSTPDPVRLRAFQNYVDPKEGPTAFSPTMARPDAATRSQCHIEVTGAQTSFAYVPGPPHVTPALDPISFKRAAAGPGSRPRGR